MILKTFYATYCALALAVCVCCSILNRSSSTATTEKAEGECEWNFPPSWLHSWTLYSFPALFSSRLLQGWNLILYVCPPTWPQRRPKVSEISPLLGFAVWTQRSPPQFFSCLILLSFTSKLKPNSLRLPSNLTIKKTAGECELISPLLGFTIWTQRPPQFFHLLYSPLVYSNVEISFSTFILQLDHREDRRWVKFPPSWFRSLNPTFTSPILSLPFNPLSFTPGLSSRLKSNSPPLLRCRAEDSSHHLLQSWDFSMFTLSCSFQDRIWSSKYNFFMFVLFRAGFTVEIRVILY